MTNASKSGDKPAKPVTQPPPKTAKPATKTVKTKSVIAVKQKAAKKRAAPQAGAEKTTAVAIKKPAVAAKAKGTSLAPEQRRYYVEVAAYYIAERRGFQGGSQLEDWANAEAEIDRLLREGILKP